MSHPIAQFLAEPFEDRTMPAMLARALREHPERRFLRVIEPREGAPMRALSFSAFGRLVHAAAAWLTARGVGPRDRVLILGQNSPEWQALSLATQLLRAHPVGLFASLDASAAQAAMAQTQPKVVMCGDVSQWHKLATGAQQAGVRHVILEDGARVDPGEGLQAWGVDAVFASAPLAPDTVAALTQAVREDDVFLILFTSGTTGAPRGVKVGQGGMAHALDAGRHVGKLQAHDEGLMFLPYGHIAGQAQFYLGLAVGHGMIHVARRDELEAGMAQGPTFIFSVPFVYARIMRGVLDKLATLPAPLRALATGALEAAARVRCEGSASLRDKALMRVADALVGRALKAKLGGKLRFLVGGGAPTPPALWRFFEALGIPYLDGFGMSETSTFISSQSLDLPRRAGSVGRTTTRMSVRVADDGELQVKGATLMLGYLDAEDDAQALTPDGFFPTGDLAQIDQDGTLAIVGRKKSLLVLSTGKKVSPEPLEARLRALEGVEEVALVGDDEAFLAVIFFVTPQAYEALQARGEPQALMLARAREALSERASYERPGAAIVLSGSPQAQPGLLTPTLKLRRAALLAWQARALDAIYGRG